MQSLLNLALTFSVSFFFYALCQFLEKCETDGRTTLHPDFPSPFQKEPFQRKNLLISKFQTEMVVSLYAHLGVMAFIVFIGIYDAQLIAVLLG